MTTSATFRRALMARKFTREGNGCYSRRIDSVRRLWAIVHHDSVSISYEIYGCRDRRGAETKDHNELDALIGRAVGAAKRRDLAKAERQARADWALIERAERRAAVARNA